MLIWQTSNLIETRDADKAIIYMMATMAQANMTESRVIALGHHIALKW